MFTLQQAQEAEAFANSHKCSGISGPRSEVFSLGFDDKWGLKVYSLSLHSAGAERWTTIDCDLVYTKQGLCRVLGY